VAETWGVAPFVSITSAELDEEPPPATNVLPMS
jgi:hypothetical protein